MLSQSSNSSPLARQFPVALIFLGFLFLLPSFGRAAAAPSEAERVASLVEGAKKEGKVVWYTTIPADTTTKFIKKFQETYPFIEFDIWRSGDENLMNKVLLEIKAKRYTFDLVQTTLVPTEIFKAKGLYAKYLSPHRDFYTNVCKDPEGYWTDIFLNLTTIGYNTKLVSAQEAPKTWYDLLDPKWKGKMGMDTKAFDWFAYMLKTMGEEKGIEYMKRLSQQNIKFRTGRTLNTQILVAGDVSIGVTLYNYSVEQHKAKGAPVEWVAMEPVVPEQHPLGITAHAPHPHAAKLFIDFMLSREGQEVMAGTFRIPSRTDVEAVVPKLKKGFKIMPIDYSIIKDYGRYMKLYRETLMKR